MAKRTGGTVPKQKPHLFKPGQSGNPRGRPPLPPEVRRVRELTREDLVELGLMVFTGDVEKLRDIVKRAESRDNPPTPMQVLLATTLIKAIQKGDVNVVNAMLDRFFGKVPIALLVAKAPEAREPKDVEVIRSEARALLEDMAADD